MTEIGLRPVADADGYAYVERLVGRNDLPTADIRDGDGEFYVAVRDETGERVGCGGIERHGDAGLLRSVVVERHARGEGVGRAACERLCAIAEEGGLDRLYLLTTTAAGFFETRGFERVERATAPQAVRETREFAELCPDAAVFMRRRLG